MAPKKAPTERLLWVAKDGIMQDLKKIIYTILKEMSGQRELNGRGVSAFYFTDIVSRIGLKHPDKIISKKDLKSDLKNLIREGRVKQINTCTPMFLLSENHFKYFEKKHPVKIMIHDKKHLQKLLNIFPDTKVSEFKEILFTDMSIAEFDSFKWMYKEISADVELIWI